MEDELKQIEGLLTPKFNRECPDYIYTNHVRKPAVSVWWKKVVGAAAMIAVIFTVGFAAFYTPAINAEEVVKTSFQNFVRADTYKASFFLLATPSGDDEIYKIAPDGNRVEGTMYMKYVDDTPMVRFEWNDDKHTVVIYSGGKYLCYKNGQLTARHDSSPILNLKEITNLSTAELLADKTKLEKSITENGDKITLSTMCKDIMVIAEFSADNKRMIKVGAKLNDVKFMETETIEYGINLPDSLFE